MRITSPLMDLHHTHQGRDRILNTNKQDKKPELLCITLALPVHHYYPQHEQHPTCLPAKFELCTAPSKRTTA